MGFTESTRAAITSVIDSVKEDSPMNDTDEYVQDIEDALSGGFQPGDPVTIWPPEDRASGMVRDTEPGLQPWPAIYQGTLLDGRVVVEEIKRSGDWRTIYRILNNSVGVKPRRMEANL